MGSDLKQMGREADREIHTDNAVAQVLFPLETRQKKKLSQSVFYRPAYFYSLDIWILCVQSE